MKTAVIHVIGRIQEVGYRTRVIGLANVSNIKGYVRNLPDNSVEIIAQGEEEPLKEFINDIEIQDSFIHIDKVKVTYSDGFKGFKDFHKIVGPNETDSRLDKAVDELKNVVTAINNMNQNMQEGFNKMDHNHVELVSKMDETNHSIQELKNEVKEGNQEIVNEIHVLREDSNESIRNDIQEVKALLKAYLKIP